MVALCTCTHLFLLCACMATVLCMQDQPTTVLDTETNGTSNPSVMLFAADTDADSGLGMVSTSLPAHLGRSSSENVTSTGTILLANRYDPREKDLQGYEAGDRSSPPVTQLSIV
eukprot:scpid97160/ scgid5496/ 